LPFEEQGSAAFVFAGGCLSSDEGSPGKRPCSVLGSEQFDRSLDLPQRGSPLEELVNDHGFGHVLIAVDARHGTRN
jgi:hypothetical protein